MSDSNRKSWNFVPSAMDLRVLRAEGHYLHLDTGQTILDAAGGAIVANIGYGREEVAEAVAHATASSGYVVPSWGTPEREGLVAQLRDAWLPEQLTQVYFGSGGSETVDAALRAARFYHVAKGDLSRTKIIYRDISYHGAGLSNMSISGHPARRAGLEPLLMNMPSVPTPYPLRFEPSNELPDAGVAAARALEETIEREGAETIAAFIAEPITGSSGGAIVPPDSYWPLVRKICDASGILLIADEVMTGFGRTGAKFAVNHWDIIPDLLIAGKGLAGGYAPLGGVYAKSEIVDPMAATGSAPMFYTFGGHPGACAAAQKVLEIIERETLVERVADMGPVFEEKLGSLRAHENVAELRGRGFLWGIEILKDRTTLEPFAGDANVTAKIVGKALSDGVFLYPGGTGQVRDIICVGPAFTLQETEMSQIADVLENAINHVISTL